MKGSPQGRFLEAQNGVTLVAVGKPGVGRDRERARVWKRANTAGLRPPFLKESRLDSAGIWNFGDNRLPTLI